MLHILLLILKIIGIVLLVLLGLLLAVILIVLFVPFRYRAEGVFQNKELQARAGVTWLLHLIGVEIAFDKGLTGRVRVGPVTLKRIGGQEGKPPAQDEIDGIPSDEAAGPDSENASDAALTPAKEAAEAEETAASETADAGGETPAGKASDSPAPVSKKPAQDSASETQGEPKTEKKSKKSSRKKGASKGDPGEDKSLADRVEEIIDALTDEGNQELFFLVCRQLRRVLKMILPRDWFVGVRLGLSDCETMGKVTAAAATAYGLFYPHFEFEPDFEEECMEGSFRLKGKIRIATFVYAAIRILLNPNARKLIKQLL